MELNSLEASLLLNHHLTSFLSKTITLPLKQAVGYVIHLY